MSTARRLLASAILILLSGGVLFAGTDYYGVVIRSLEPMDFVVLKKVKVNDKDEFRQLSRSAPLTERQYKKLPTCSCPARRGRRETWAGLPGALR